MDDIMTPIQVEKIQKGEIRAFLGDLTFFNEIVGTSIDFGTGIIHGDKIKVSREEAVMYLTEKGFILVPHQPLCSRALYNVVEITWTKLNKTLK